MIAYYIGAAGFTALFLTAFATDHPSLRTPRLILGGIGCVLLIIAVAVSK